MSSYTLKTYSHTQKKFFKVDAAITIGIEQLKQALRLVRWQITYISLSLGARASNLIKSN